MGECGHSLQKTRPTAHHYTHLVQQHCSVLFLPGFSIVGRFSAPLKKLTVINCLVTVCKTQGRRLEAGDAWIIATAAHRKIPLITHDRDFAHLEIPDLTIISYADRKLGNSD